MGKFYVIAELVRPKQAAGRIEQMEDAETLAWLFMAIYLSENRKWRMRVKALRGRVFGIDNG
jgi:hypothetical protein